MNVFGRTVLVGEDEVRFEKGTHVIGAGIIKCNHHRHGETVRRLDARANTPTQPFDDMVSLRSAPWAIDGSPRTHHYFTMGGRSIEEKNRLRSAILDATVELLRTTDPKDLTTQKIAAVAGVSQAMVFNLVGTRDQLIQALIDRVLVSTTTELVELGAHTGDDPITAARMIIEHSIAAFTSDSTVYRRALARVSSTEIASLTPAFDAAILQIGAIRAAQERGIVSLDFDAVGLGRQIFVTFLGATSAWARGRVDDRGYLTSGLHGLVSVLAATATDGHREAFRDELRALTSALVAHTLAE